MTINLRWYIVRTKKGPGKGGERQEMIQYNSHFSGIDLDYYLFPVFLLDRPTACHLEH